MIEPIAVTYPDEIRCHCGERPEFLVPIYNMVRGVTILEFRVLQCRRCAGFKS